MTDRPDSPTPALPRRIHIIGLGLMGGSLGLALRALNPSIAIAGYDVDPEAARGALARGAVTELADAPERIHTGSDVIALAVPPRAAAALVAAAGPIGTLGSALPPGTLVMDLSSVMLPPLAAAMEARPVPLADRYVAAHPLAGSESSGVGAARADLFAGAAVLIGRPLDPGSPGARIAALWSALGAHPSAIAPPLHDALVALTSHLPYAASVALVRTLRRTGSMTRALAETAGPGLRDTTRVAASPSTLWAEILSLNGPKLIPALELLEREVRALRRAISEGGPALRTHLEEARAFREELST